MCRCHRRCCQTEEIQLSPAYGAQECIHTYVYWCCRCCHFIISLFRYASFVCSCVCECLLFFHSFLKMEHRFRGTGGVGDANIFNSEQHFSVKCQLIDFFLSHTNILSLSLSQLCFFSLYVSCVWAINNRVEYTYRKTSNEKKAFRIKAFL